MSKVRFNVHVIIEASYPDTEESIPESDLYATVWEDVSTQSVISDLTLEQLADFVNRHPNLWPETDMHNAAHEAIAQARMVQEQHDNRPNA